jgi:hypothetical protein
LCIKACNFISKCAITHQRASTKSNFFRVIPCISVKKARGREETGRERIGNAWGEDRMGEWGIGIEGNGEKEKKGK